MLLPETFDLLLVPATLAGVIMMFIGLIAFKVLDITFSATEKQNIMAVLTVISGAAVALIQVLPPETVAQISEWYDALRPFLNFVLMTILGGGVGYTVNQGAYRAYRKIVPQNE